MSPGGGAICAIPEVKDALVFCVSVNICQIVIIEKVIEVLFTFKSRAENTMWRPPDKRCGSCATENVA